MRPAWARSEGIPRGPAAVLAFLDLSGAGAGALDSLGDEDWRAALAFADRAQLTLLLGRSDGAHFPEWVQERLDRNFRGNCGHTERLRGALLEIAGEFDKHGIEFAALKGFAHAADFLPDPCLRVQYDLDLYCRPAGVISARDALLELGFKPSTDLDGRPLDHLPTMVRMNGWKWKGDYFDPNMPLAVDLHFRLWDKDTERFDAPGVEEFWGRRAEMRVAGRNIGALSKPDTLGYAALHALRHWLRGSLKPMHIYELAWFLHHHCSDDAFWETWREAHPEALRRLECLPFRLAREWFGCGEPPAVTEHIQALPRGVDDWFQAFPASPVEAMFRPTKPELWLHWELLDSAVDKLRVARRRMLPLQRPSTADPEHVESAGHIRQFAWRVAYHARALADTARQAARWKLQGALPERPFWVFLAAASLFNFGMFVFFVLYNLRLLELGYRENVIGWIAAATTLGSIAGALPAGALIARLGVRNALLACFACVPAMCAVRSVATGVPALVAAAFAAGALLSLWAVSIPPTVAQLTTDRTRPLGFSITFGSGIALGILGGLAGGHLPRLLAALGGKAFSAKEAALLAGSAVMAAALIPAARLHLARAAPHRRVQYPRNAFLFRFLGVMALWTTATASFNPFFNAYFSTRLHATTEWIGGVFAGSQFAQAIAVLLAPLALRALGRVRGIVAMQLAAAITLAALARGPGLWGAGALYATYMSFQYMSEPGLYSLLMGNLRPEERTGGSALNSLVVFSAQAGAAFAAGTGVARLGYGPIMLSASAIAITSALLFGVLLGPFGRRRAP